MTIVSRFRVSPVMTTSISLHKYDATACIILMELDEMRLNELCSLNPLRIPHPKIDKLACQAQGVGILAKGELTLHDANCTFLKFGTLIDHDIISHLFQKIKSF